MTESSPALSQRVANLHASPIRDILSVIERPGMVSFAGGLPAPDVLPDFAASEIPSRLLQYGPTEGEPELRARIAEEARARGLACTTEQVIVLSGSQQGIDLVAKLFVDPGTQVAVESPTYLAALQVFRFFGASFREFSGAGSVSSVQALDGCAFAYTIPNFQNPTGRCLSTAARECLARACDESGVTLFEDDPYRDLNYADCATDPVCARLERASWIYQGSFSKSLAPGLRLGYLVASPDLVPHLVRLKQAADLHSNRVSQWFVLSALEAPHRAARAAELIEHYRGRRDAFARALDRHFGDLATWQLPPGGLFFWLELIGDRRLDTRTLLPLAIAENVAFMPGEPFYANSDGPAHALRLNFSHAGHADAERALAVLGRLVRTHLEERAVSVRPGPAPVQDAATTLSFRSASIRESS